MMLKASKSTNEMVMKNQQLLDSLLDETKKGVDKWSEANYKKEVNKGRSLFKAMKRSF